MHWIKLGNSYENLDNVVRVVKEYDEKDKVTMLRVESTDRLWTIRDPEHIEKLLRSLGALCAEDAGSSSDSGREELLALAKANGWAEFSGDPYAYLQVRLDGFEHANAQVVKLAREYGWDPNKMSSADFLRAKMLYLESLSRG